MSRRLKLMAGAALVLVPLAACDEGTPPPPTGSIEGQVSIEGQGVDGVTVTLSGGGATATTSGGGAYRFTDVEGGTYTVTISGYPSDASFDATSASATIASANQVVRLNFTGSYIRTASVLGRVTVEGAGQANVKVTLSGTSDATTATDGGGDYAFTGLRAGTYTVEISEFDAGSYGFSNTSQSATVGVGASANVNFAGTHIRTASIRGTVSVDGEGLGGVRVSLSGGSEASATTDGAGSYAFTDLQAGAYTVAISGFDASEYGFDATTRNATLGVGEAANLNFAGTALRTASVTGRLFVDELNKNNEWDANEAYLEVAGVKVILTGPGVADSDTTTTDARGAYGFDSLVAGSYRVSVDHAGAAKDTAVKLPSWVGYGGRAGGYLVTLASGTGTATQNFPFDITRQTVKVRAVYGDSASVAKGGDLTPAVGVQVELHATSGAATAGGKGGLGSKKTDAKGYAMFEFDRAADTGPGGGLVYARATAVAGTALNGTHTMPVEYEPVDQEVSAGAPFRVLSTRAILEFAVENLSNDGESGGDPMPGWAVHVRADSAKAAPFDTLKSAAKTGKVSVTYNNVKPGQKYYIRLPGSAEVSDTVESQDTAVTKGEAFKLTATAGEDGGRMSVALDKDTATAATQFLTYTHDGMSVPATKMDLGTIAVTFTTQTLIVGVHQERDNIRGYTNITPGDTRPAPADDGDAANNIDADIEVSLFEPGPRGYPVPLKDEDGRDMSTTKSPTTYQRETRGKDNGLIRWENLPSDKKVIVRAVYKNDRIRVTTDRLNVFGDDVDTERTGTTGAFGGDGGLMPVVQFCPQKFESNIPEYLCSTFGYKFKNGEINLLAHSKTYASGDSVPAAGIVVKARRIKGLGATSPKPDTTGARGAARFQNLVDGTYEVTVAADASGNWDFGNRRPDTVVVLGGIYAANQNYDTSGETLQAQATYQKTTIEGTVANDRTADDAVDDEETRRGLVVTLHRKPATGSRYARVASATTDSDGEYVFKNVPEGTYRVEGAEGDDYRLCTRSAGGLTTCSTPGARGVAAKSVDVTTQADLANRVYERDTTLPDWNPWASIVQDQGDDTDFVVLFKSTRLSGRVTKDSASVRSDYVGIEVRAYLCDQITVGNPVGSKCTGFANNGRPDATATTDDEGEWEIDGLLEGGYRISLDVPQGATSAPTLWELAGAGTGGLPTAGEDQRVRNLNFVVTIN